VKGGSRDIVGVTSQHLAGATEDNHENRGSGWAVS